jgi:antitoxin Phd
MAFRGRVLLVDESATARAGRARALSKAGFEAETVSGGREAVDLVRRSAFDVVVWHVKRSGTDDLRLVKNLCTLEAGTSFVLLCEDASNELKVRAAELGVQQVLQTPVDAKLLERAVTVCVNQAHRAVSMLRHLLPPAVTPRMVPATTAKNDFSEVLEEAVGGGAVVITKHDTPKAVLVSYERLSALTRREPDLTALTHEFDALVARMRTPKARAAARGFSSMTSAELGQAALDAAAPHRD